MAVGMDVSMVMSVAVEVGGSHQRMLYYNITGVHRLVRNCRRYSSVAPRSDPENMLLCCSA